MLDWQKNNKKGLIIRIIAIILIQSFLLYDLAWAGAADVFKSKRNWSEFFKQLNQNSFSQNQSPSQETTPEKEPPKITIPQELGSIKETFLSKTSKQLVIHIQDDHANYESQVNEAKLIEYLGKNYDTELVAVEGGFGDFEANFFRSFPKDKTAREKIAQYFLKKAFLSGADYLLVTADNPPTVYGAEEKSLYLEHLSKFRQNEANQASIDNYIEELQPILKSLKEQFYSKELKELDVKINDFNQERIALNEYLAYLKSKADKYRLDLKDYPNLSNLTKLQELEGNIDFEQAEIERQLLIDTLTKALSKEDLAELVKKSLDFKASRLTPGEYYSYLESLTQKTWVSKSVYSNLFSYIQYVRLSEKLDNTKVFPEIERFVEALKEKLFASSAEKDIDRLSHYIKVLKGLIEIKLSPNDLEYFKEHKKEISSYNFAQIIKQYNYSASLPKAFAFENYIDSFEDFYKIALKRDDAIVSNSLVKADKTEAKSLILVAGGFHSAGIKSILKEKDISYVVIAPCIKLAQNKDSVYFSLLKEKKLLLDDVLYEPDTLQIINSISDPEARSLLITYWVARASRYYSLKELQVELDRLSLSGDDRNAVQLALKEISPSETTIVKQEGEIAPAVELSTRQETLVKSVPLIPQGPTLLEKFISFVSFLKPKPKPKEIKLAKQEKTEEPITTTKIEPVLPEQDNLRELIIPQPQSEVEDRIQGPTLLEKFTSFIASLKPKPKPKSIEIVKQELPPASHELKSEVGIPQEKPPVQEIDKIINKPIFPVIHIPHINYKPFLSGIVALTFSLFFPSALLAQSNAPSGKLTSSLHDLLSQPAVFLIVATLTIGYIVYRIVKRSTKKDVRPVQGIIIPQEQILEEPFVQPRIQIPRRPFIAPTAQITPGIPLNMRQEIETQIRHLSDSVSRSSKDALARSFRSTGPAELPLPMPLTMLNQNISDREKIIRILENMQRMMDGTDEKVLRDFERAIDNARDRVTEQALAGFDELSDEQIYQLITSGYLQELQREFQRIIENQIEHMVRFHTPSLEEQSLYVSDEINERYPRLPRYLKWLLTNNPQLENEPLVRDWLNTIQMRMNRIPAFPEMITEYSKDALNKSLYLNPELAMRVIRYLAKGIIQDRRLSEEEIRRQIEAELARNLPEDVIEVSEIVEEEEALPRLPFIPQPKALPAPDMDKAESLKAQLKAITEDYARLVARFKEQEAVVKKTEVDLGELSEGLEEARRQNDRVIIEALKPAVEGLSSKLRRAKENLSRLQEQKARFEEQINQLKKELGETGTTLYAIEPLSIMVIAVFTMMFGIPLYITKKILNKHYNTTTGKTLGLGASLSTIILSYYAYFTNLSPEVSKIFTNPGNANWPILANFFIVWPIAIIAGIFAGKFGKGISHERLYHKANSAFKKGNLDEAIALLNQAIKIKSKDVADYRLLAECQRKRKHFDEAITAYKKALEIEPNDSTTHNNLGVVYAEKDDYAKAIESYKRSLEIEPNDAIVNANLGRSLHKKGQLLEAAQALQRAQQIRPDTSVTEELNRILQEVGRLEKPKKPIDLPYLKTMKEVVPSRSEWIKEVYSDMEWAGGVIFVGLLVAGAFLYAGYHFHWWQLGTEQATKTTKWIAWLGSGIIGPLLAVGFPFIVGVSIDVFRTVWRFFRYPLDYRRLQEINNKPSEELPDKQLERVAPIYGRMSKEYLEKIFRNWIEVGHEEKIVRLFKFGKWQSDKTRIYADIGEYKVASRQAATKFADTAQEQKAILDGIDGEKEKLTQKGINNAVGLIKEVLPQITEHSRDRDEFWHWLVLVVGLPKNIWQQGPRQVLTVFADQREYARSQEESFKKFAPSAPESYTKVKSALYGLAQKLEKDGLNYAGLLKTALVEVNKASRNLDEFLFWINELMQFDKRIWSSGSQLSILQNLIAYVHSKEEASKKLCKTAEETSRLFQAVDSLRQELQKKGVSGDVSILKDVIPRVAEASRNLTEFFEYIAVLKAFDKNMWHGTQSVLQAFNNHVSFKQARESAAAKFTSDDSSRQKFFADIDNLRNQLVQKGIPPASDLLKDILPELTKTCRSKEEFIYWLGELVGLNVSVWHSGAQAVVNNFNDLAGFKQAKEMALDKLCANQQEKDELVKTIDSLKAKLEEKRPSCAGLIKDLILEILKDIDTLANPPYRKTDFVWWLTMCVNFETQTWAAGIKQVLAGYQELREYIRRRRELSAKFTTNPEEQQRLTAVWDNLDKTANFTKPAIISLLNNTIGKIANVSANPREFVFWVGSLSELHNEVLEVFCRDITTIFEYYKDKAKTRDFNHLPAVLNQYHKTYHQTVLITANLLDILTDSSVDIDKRVEKASQYIIEQKIVKLGAPANLVGLKDAVSFEQLLAIAGEGGFSSILNFHWQEESSSDEYGSSSYDTSHQPIRQIVPKMGRDGMYSHWESQHPAYYRQFLEETQGLAPGFNRPGEKFRVAYDGRVVTWSNEEEAQIVPIADSIQALQQLIQYLRMEWPNLYDNFMEPKRAFIKDRHLEEFVTSDTVVKMAEQLLGKVQNWQFSEQQRAVFLIKIMEIFAFSETTDLRVRINNATDDFNKLRLIAQYWEKVLELILKHKWLQEKSKFYQSIAKIIKQRIATINEKIGDGSEGVLQFYLSGGTVADLFRGIVSCDCTKPGAQAFQTTIGTIIDPGFFLFKIIENGKWVGNVYSVVFKTQDNKFALFVDVFQMNLQHPLVASADNWNGKRDRFIQAFFQELKSYLASQGFDYLIFASTHSSQKIASNIHNEVVKESGKTSTESLSLKKPGGIGHLSEGSLSVEYVQGIGNISGGFQSVSGYKIALDKTTPQVILQKQRDLDYLEKLLGEMAAEESRLLNLIKEKQVELSQINQKGQEAANSGKNTLAVALKTASDQKQVEIQKIEYELGELKAKLQERKQEVERLRSDLGMLKAGKPQAIRLVSSPVGKVLSVIPLVGLLNLLFFSIARAQGFSPTDELTSLFTPFLIVIGGVAAFFSLIYILSKLFPEGPKYEPYHGSYYPQRPLFEEYKLPEDVKGQLDKALEKVSPEIQELIPRHVDIRVPYEVGINRNQAVKALRLLFSKLIEHNSILNFLKGQEFYRRFKQRAKELNLADNFDEPEHQYFFSVAKENIQNEEDRRAEEFIHDYLVRLNKEFKISIPEKVGVDTEILKKITSKKERLRRIDASKKIYQVELKNYYQLLKTYAYLRFQDKLRDVDSISANHKYLEAVSLIEEFLRVGIGAELIALEPEVYLRDSLNRILNGELKDVHWQFNRLTAFQARKQEVVEGVRDIQYELRLSERSSDDILRGVASGDCTAINGTAFYNTIPQFLFDPGLLAFKVYQDGKWVGNVYTIVAERENEPILIIDAIQLPVWGRSWPISVRELADKVLEKIVEYAEAQGFSQVLMSSFVSNFNAIHEHLGSKYPAQPMEIEKVEGFEHLKALGLWDEYATRNEYLETYSPQWNYSLRKVNPNNPRQTLLLRKIWGRNQSYQEPETSPDQVPSLNQEEIKGSSPVYKPTIKPKDNKSGFFNASFQFIQNRFKTIAVTAMLFVMLALPNIANAARFEMRSGPENKQQVVAVVERGDNLWDIAGVAYRGMEGIGSGKYAAHSQWPRIYQANPQLPGQPGEQVGSQYPETKQIVVIRPADELIVPGPVNYEALGLKAPTAQPSTPEVKTPEVKPSEQQIPQMNEELQRLQQQKLQVEQELNQLQQQRRVVQSELENLQKEKTEIIRQILELKKQLADAQEQLRQAKEKISPSLQTEEARRQALEEEIKQLEQKKDQYAQEIADFEKQYQQAQDDLRQITAQKEKAAQELKQLQEQTPQAQESIKNLQDEIQRLESQRKQHQENLTKLQEQKDNLQKSVDQFSQDKENLQKDLQDLKQQIQEVKSVLEEAKQKAQPTLKNIWRGLSGLEKAGIIILFLTVIGAVGGIIILVKRWGKFKRLQGQIEKLQKEAKDLESKLGTLRAEEKDLVKMRQDAETVKLESQEEAKRIAQQQAQFEEERRHLEQVAEDLQAQQEDINRQRQSLATLEEQKQTVRDQIQQLEVQRDILKGSLAKVQQETQEAIRKAKELEEEATAQAQLSQATLTEEQRSLQEQLDAKKQEVDTQLNALEEKLKEAQIRHNLDMQEIEQKKAQAQSELTGLISERDATKNNLEEMEVTVVRLNEEKNKLLLNLQDLDSKQKALELSIKELKEEEVRLRAEVEELKKVEELKPEVEKLAKEAEEVARQADSLLGIVGPQGNNSIYSVTTQQIKSILGNDEFEIQEAPLSEYRGRKNIIVTMPATKGLEHLPKVILNAHMDIHDHGYNVKSAKGKEKIPTGALDDRAGVVAILSALTLLKEKITKQNIAHGPMLLLFTDLEESNAVGADDLVEKYTNKTKGYESLFDNTHIVIVLDGPIVWFTDRDLKGMDDNGRQNPFVIAKLLNLSKDNRMFETVYNAVKPVSFKDFSYPRYADTDGPGDHRAFARVYDAKQKRLIPVINLRSPYNDINPETGEITYHSANEKVDIENELTPVAQWVAGIVIGLIKGMTSSQETSGIPHGSAGVAKGKGMFTPEEHEEVNDAILSAQQEERGYLIWGDTKGWRQTKEKDKYTQDIAWIISSLKRYPSVHVAGLGKINIPEVILTSNIILIQPRNNSPPSLVVKSKDAYQIAHSGDTFNSIYIDEVIFKQLYSFEVAMLLAHEAIELAAKKIARQKHIPWTVELAKKVHQIAEEYEIQIVGKSLNGRGSRFDDHIEEILDFTSRAAKPAPKQPKQSFVSPEPQRPQREEAFIPKKEPVKQDSATNTRTLTFDEPRQDIIDSLRKLFMDSMLRDLSSNLPATVDSFPAPIASEIKQAYQLEKIKGMPLDADFMVVLTLFFSKLFPNHANRLIQYMRELTIYLVDNGRSTYGATLSGNTFYIQRSCLEDILGRPITVAEIYQGVKSKNTPICVALFRIIIHEIGSAFFKLSHPADQDLEKVFLTMLAKTSIELSSSTQQEISTINRTTNLDAMARIDWAQKRTIPLDSKLQPDTTLSLDNLFSLSEEVHSLLVSSLYAGSQTERNEAAQALAQLGDIKALTFLRLLQEKEPNNEIVKSAIGILEQGAREIKERKLKSKIADPFAKSLFTFDRDDNLVLTTEAIQALNSLSIAYNGLTLEIDVDTLIDTSRGTPQLKGLGFKEAVASLYKAQENKEIPENLRIRLININPHLDKAKIIKVLGLTEDLLKEIVNIPDIPEDYLLKGLEPYLIAGSIRVIFEDNLRYWGDKVDILVKKGQETEVLSSLGLIVASLAKEPKFYQSLPQEVKDYIVAVTDEKGNVVLDNDKKIKQLIFKPIEKTKVDTEYLERLNRANKKLEGNV